MRSLSFAMLLVFTCHFVLFAQQPPFTQANVVLPQLAYSSCAWGDLDQDGDLDLAMTGAEGNTPVTKFLRNDNGIFTEIGPGPSLHFGSAEWGDTDHDGDLDLLVTGMDNLGNPYTWIILNEGGSFASGGIPLTGVMDGQATFGDMNNDGYLDVLLAGSSMVRIFKNDGTGNFDTIDAVMPNLEAAVCCWVDYNNDGQLDIMVCGNTGGGIVSQLFRNDHGSFTEVTITPEPFTGLYGGQVKWADLDNDGDQDMAIAGMDLFVDGHFIFYRNDGDGQFTKFEYPEANLLSPYFDLADYNADGLTDVALIGTIAGCGGPPVTMLLKNTGSFVFNTISTLIPGYKLGSVNWGDYNNDGFSDLLLTGLDAFDFPKTALYLNNLGDTSLFITNTAPATPNNPSVTLEADKIILHWNRASDLQTPANGLSYNIRVGTQPDNHDILSPLASLTTGSRLVANPGNASSDTSYTIAGIPAGTYFFSVQAIDNGFMAGAFSSPCAFTYTPLRIDQKGNALLYVFPNPCHDRVTIHKGSEPEPAYRIRIIGVTGKCFYDGINPENLDISSWPNGIYVVQKNTDRKTTSIKFIKN